MFGKKCSKCSKKVSESYDFCPFCGANMKSEFDEQDYGILGKNDFVEDLHKSMGFQGISLGKLFNSALRELPQMVRMLEKQMKEETDKMNDKDVNNVNFQFFVNGKKVRPHEMNNVPRAGFPRVSRLPRALVKKEQLKPVKKMISKDKLKKMSKLPRKEPESKVRRLSGKMIYEMNVPGVFNTEDIFINQLENTIEVKALSEGVVYQKTINLNLPILRYILNNENLILELQAK